jgi:hypothetical protein
MQEGGRGKERESAHEGLGPKTGPEGCENDPRPTEVVGSYVQQIVQRHPGYDVCVPG